MCVCVCVCCVCMSLDEPSLSVDGTSSQALHRGVHHRDKLGQIPGHPLDRRDVGSFQSVQDTWGEEHTHTAHDNYTAI